MASSIKIVIASVVAASAIGLALFLFSGKDANLEETKKIVGRVEASPRQGASPFGPKPLQANTELETEFARTPPSTNAISQSQLILKLSNSSDPKDALVAFRLAEQCKVFRDRQRSDGNVEEEALRKKCGDISEDQIRGRLLNLEKAVNAKVPGAAAAFLDVGPVGGDMSALETRPNDPLVIEWKKRALALLLESAKSGDAASVMELSLIYHNGGIVEPDREAALMYETADQEIQKSKSKISARRQADYDNTIRYLSYGLTEQQSANAKENGRNFASSCCVQKNKANLKDKD